MLKYHKELETPDKIILPLINAEPHKTYRFNPPLSFYEKYASLFGDFKNINTLIKEINIDALFNATRPFLSNEERDRLYDNISIITQLIEDDGQYLLDLKILLPNNQNNDSVYEISDYCPIDYILRFYRNFLNSIFAIYPKIKNYYEKTYELIDKAIKELEKYEIEYYDSKDCSILYPNAWYITPYGDLYDIMPGDSHQEQNLIRPMINVEENLEKMTTSTIYDKYYLDEIEEYRNLLKRGNVTFGEFQHYLNYENVSAIAKIKKEDFMYSKNFFGEKSYEHRVFKTVLGIVSAQAAFYKFFSDLAKYTNNPSEEYKKVIEMTKGIRADILVRCVGFHKIETSQSKTITTSCIDNLDIFEEYIKRGWNISLVTPIIINKEKGIVEELDISSPYIEHYIEKNIEKYAIPDSPERGKVYYKHLCYGKM